MGSTNQLLVDEDKSLVKVEPASKPRTHQKRTRNKTKSRLKQKRPADSFPAFKEWYGVLVFLSLPVLMLAVSKISGTPLPKPILYGVAGLLGLYLVFRSYYSAELVFAVALIYFPFSKIFVIPIAPGLNGTNVFLLLVLMAGFFRSQRTRTPLVEMIPGTKVMLFFGVLSAYSVVTLIMLPGGFSYFKSDIWHSYKAWLDQFILYFVALSVIRDRDLAKRVVIYMIIGSMLVNLFSLNEMLAKRGMSSLDKSRVGGPFLQPNNYGGFVAYTMLPVVGLFIAYIHKIKAWIITPYLLFAVKMLIVSFSRGAYVALAAGGLVTGFLRGRAFFFSWALFALIVVAIFPSVLPESVLARLGDTEQAVSTSSTTLDKSSQTRLIMWEAAIEMTTESPVFGKGFGAFPFLKEHYTDQYVLESDPHSMFFYISSQMGIPALVLFLLIFLNMFVMGRKLAKTSDDPFIRGIGYSGAGIAACLVIVNMFGSRFVNLDFTCYLIVFYVVIQKFHSEQLELDKLAKKQRKKSRHFPKPAARAEGL